MANNIPLQSTRSPFAGTLTGDQAMGDDQRKTKGQQLKGKIVS